MKISLASKRFFAKTAKILLKSLIIILVTVAILAAALYGAMYVLVNGPSPTVGKLFVLSLKETSAGGFIADWFMSEEEISALQAERAEEEAASIDPDLIKLPQREEVSEPVGDETSDRSEDSYIENTPSSKNENEVLPGIELHNVGGATYNGKMLIIKDPTRVFLGVPDKYGENEKGLSLTQMINKYGAVGGTNAGGFIDPNGSGTGGMPEGISEPQKA